LPEEDIKSASKKPNPTAMTTATAPNNLPIIGIIAFHPPFSTGIVLCTSLENWLEALD